MIWYSYLSKNFPQFVVTHTVKGFNIVNEAEVDGVFFGGGWGVEFLCFFFHPVDVGNLISSSPAFINPACTSGSSQFMYFRSLALRILSLILLACEMNATVL